MSFVVRKNILPKNFFEIIPCAFLLCIIPIIYWFEIWVVLPGLYTLQTSPLTYTSLFILGHYLLFNVTGNLMAVMIHDTSIRGRRMPSIDSPAASGYCDTCGTATPARSYHCPSCNVCILRRDHHCLFTACCIGHFNYRYFLMFLLHMLLSITLCTPFNLIYLWDQLTFYNLIEVSKIFFPVIITVTGIKFDAVHFYLLLLTISVGGVIFIALWFYFHMKLAMGGCVVHELKRDVRLYDLGFRGNMEEAFGKRWHLVWLSPFISSELVGDGITFRQKKHSS